MLVTFKCKAYADIIMFGDVGIKMLEMMGFGDRVPGAIRAEDVPEALANLRRALDATPEPPPDEVDSEDDAQPVISLHTRALPLLELLQAAIDDDCQLRWV